MAKDMFERMLENLVDHAFSKIGYTRDQVQGFIQNFIKDAAKTRDTMKRIELNQLLLIEAENERRRELGKPELSAVLDGDSTAGTGSIAIN